MIFPSINRQPSYRVEIPSMNGGINTHDAITAIGDNQMISGENVYFDKGYLSTRPGTKALLSTPKNTQFVTSVVEKKSRVLTTKSPISITGRDKKYYVVVEMYNYTDGLFALSFTYLLSEDKEELEHISSAYSMFHTNTFLVQDGNYVYAF